MKLAKPRQREYGGALKNNVTPIAAIPLQIVADTLPIRCSVAHNASVRT